MTARRESAVKGTRTPVFIVGSPRSGTTLLRVTLNRHSELAVCGETHYFARLYAKRSVFGDPADVQNRARIIDAYLKIAPIRRLGLDMDALKQRLNAQGVTWRALFASLVQTYADSTGKQFAGEKTPAHALHVSTLCDWFPECTIIHMVRDPRAVVNSLREVPWASRSVLVGTRTWREFNSAAMAAAGRENYIRIKYEDLVVYPQEQLKKICEHVGIEYQESMLHADPAEFDPKRPVFRAWEKITPSRMARWETQLQRWQVAAIETTAGDIMAKLGYSRAIESASRAQLGRATLEAAVELSFQKMFRFPIGLCRFFQPTNLAAEQKWIHLSSALYGKARLPRRAATP